MQFSELELQKARVGIVQFNCLIICVSADQKLSEGAFGEAFLAQWHRSSVVVKTLKRQPESWTVENFIEFANEAAASEKVSKHPNVGELMLCCVLVLTRVLDQFRLLASASGCRSSRWLAHCARWLAAQIACVARFTSSCRAEVSKTC